MSVEVEMPGGGQAITVTGTAQRQAWGDRVLPPVEKVRPGVWSVPTPFPNSPLRYVLAYLLESPRGPVLIDTGWPSDEAWDGLVAGVRETGHEISDVAAVLVTHFHADHFGLAHKVREASGAWIGMHEEDARALSRFTSVADFAAAEGAWLARRGMPRRDRRHAALPASRVAPSCRSRGHDRGRRPPARRRPAAAGDLDPGHTPGHLCFADERHNLMLTGDHVLPRITPNISPSPLTTDDTLGSFLRSLSELARFDPDEVLPAHEYRFSGLPARVRQLHEHHRARLREILGVVAGAGGCTTFDVAERLSWSRPWDQNLGFVRRSAIGETYAHLVHLERRGMIANDGADSGAAANGRGETDHWRLLGPEAEVTDLIAG